jgi:hypothetical protein
MAKKDESLFGFAPLAQTPSFGDNGHMVALGSVHASNRNEQWILDEHRKQTLVMEGVEVKAMHAMRLMAEIHKEGATTFDEAAGCILAIKDDQRGKEHQAYVDEFFTRGIQMMGRHLLATMEVAATNIGVEVHRSLYPSATLETSNIWRRLFG